jgi:hypothetical protein
MPVAWAVALAIGCSVGSGAKIDDAGRVAVGVGTGGIVAVGGTGVVVGGTLVAVAVGEAVVAVGGGGAIVAVGGAIVADGVATGAWATIVVGAAVGLAAFCVPSPNRPGRRRLPMMIPMANIPSPKRPTRIRQRAGLAGAKSGSLLTIAPHS